MEAPPSYEEAIKHDAFRGYSLCTTSDVIHETQRPNSNESSNFTEVLPENPVSPTYNQPTSSQEVPASTSGCSSYQAKSGASNNCASNPLTTISEEFDEYDATNQPLTVVIDSIGVHSARLLNDCDTSVQLPKTDELTSDSKC
ncbi:uncharacterized protein LOC118184401 [Stegodyphus dumicola]|uniref:uncharacterized protein LOC118184401 n=1 Tax=Stegodyphus dumicola TaxID=202533 RepID=UPI0015AC765C|nr:uncharacterized protein LOC118184401 [Stegodyphus dumicola]